MLSTPIASLLFVAVLPRLGSSLAIPQPNGTVIPEQYRESVELTWTYSEKRAEAIMPGSTMKGYRNWAMDQIMDGDGTINVCMRWGANTTLTADTREKMVAMYTKQYERWFSWLPGWDNYPYQDFKLKVAGWAVSNDSLFQGSANGVPIYTGFQDGDGAPTCDPGCSRDMHVDGDYSACPGGLEKRFHQFFFVDPSWGKYDMGAASGPGVDISHYGWETVGSKLGDWSILIHELGHTIGFPDYVTDGKPTENMCNILWVPPAAPADWVMLPTDSGAHVPEVTEFEGWMIRHWWSRFSRLRGWQQDNVNFLPPPDCEWKLAS